MLRQLDCAPCYLAVRSGVIAAAGAGLNRRLRNAGIPDVVAKGPSIARHYSSRDETPFADIDLNVRPADVPCGAQRLRSLLRSAAPAEFVARPLAKPLVSAVRPGGGGGIA